MKLAFVFPGQGSQSVGMLQVWQTHTAVRGTFEEAGDTLGEDLWRLASVGPDDLLNQTVNTQPVMLAADIALWRVWQAAGGGQPALMAGHSLGEYAALVAAGALTFAAALRLVRFRAEAMQDAVAEGVGAMAAILGLDDATVQAVCEAAAQAETVEAVNLNSPGQVVIAGHCGAVERAMTLARERGAKRALLLPVSVPSHSSLMRPAAEKLTAYLQSVPFAVPSVPVLHNTDVTNHVRAEDIRQALVRQLHTPVRWTDTIRAFTAAGIEGVLECGPGKVLGGLAKRIDGSLTVLGLGDEAALQNALAAYDGILAE